MQTIISPLFYVTLAIDLSRRLDSALVMQKMHSKELVANITGYTSMITLTCALIAIAIVITGADINH